jgi:hypothetical protein
MAVGPLEVEERNYCLRCKLNVLGVKGYCGDQRGLIIRLVSIIGYSFIESPSANRKCEAAALSTVKFPNSYGYGNESVVCELVKATLLPPVWRQEGSVDRSGVVGQRASYVTIDNC